MTGKARGVVAAAAAVLLTGCAYAASPLTGGLYNNVQGPITASGAAGSKMGKACANSILGIVATGDASIDAARRAGNITNVSSVDHESTSILGLYATFCTIVRGN